MKRLSFGIAAAAFALACGDDGPASLTISLDKLPDVTKATSVNISGSLTRVPAKKTSYIVTVTGGAAAIADTVDSAGHFAIAVKLKVDSANTFGVSATDAQGSASPTVSVSITQDNQPPTVSKITPAFAADQVARSQTISFVLSEPVASPGVSVVMARQGVEQPGTLQVASDAVTATFTPSSALAPNSIYSMTFGGLKDAAGNIGTFNSCFVTSASGSVTQTFPDPSGQGDVLVAGTPPQSLKQIDILQTRFAKDGMNLATIVRFSNARTFEQPSDSVAWVELYLDTDQNVATGYPKDSLGLSDIGSDYWVLLEPALSDGLGAVVHWTSPTQYTITAELLPSYCGAFMGFVVPFSQFGNDDGIADVALAAFALVNATTGWADFAPNTGHLSLNLTGAPAPAPLLGGSGTRIVQATSSLTDLRQALMRRQLFRGRRNP